MADCAAESAASAKAGMAAVESAATKELIVRVRTLRMRRQR
jgi:hypothetical protein